jgi:hypothetical protein
MKRLGKLCSVIVVALVTAGISSQAWANTATACSVSDIGTSGAYAGGNQETVPELTITCGGTAYYINQNYPGQGGGCSPTYGAEIVKTWVLLATQAFSMGRHLTIGFLPSNGTCSTPTITSVDLVF